MKGAPWACLDTSALLSAVGVILIVGHGSALDSCIRPLLGLPPRSSTDFAQLVRKVRATPAPGQSQAARGRKAITRLS